MWHPLSNFCISMRLHSATFWSLHVGADVSTLSSEESRLNVDHTFWWTVKDGRGVLTHHRRHKTCSRKEPFKYLLNEVKIFVIRVKYRPYHREEEVAQVFFLKEKRRVWGYWHVSTLVSTSTFTAAYLTSPLADVSSFVLTVVVVPVATVNEYGHTVFPIIVVRVTCEKRWIQYHYSQCPFALYLALSWELPALPCAYTERLRGEANRNCSVFLTVFLQKPCRTHLALNEPAFQWMYLKGEPSIHSQPPSVMESWPPIHREIPVGLCWITPVSKQQNTI